MKQAVVGRLGREGQRPSLSTKVGLVPGGWAVRGQHRGGKLAGLLGVSATRGSLALAEDTEAGSRPGQPVLGSTGHLRPHLLLVSALEPLRPAHQWVEVPLLQSRGIPDSP